MRNDINVVSVTVAILGAFKLILESFQIDLIDDNQINAISNGVAAIITIVGVLMSHRKKGDEFDVILSASAESTK